MPVEGVSVAELGVPGCLWQRRKATAREVREAMAAFRPMSHGAMLTLLKRLEEKGLVERTSEKVGKAFYYRATGAGKPAYRRIMDTPRRRVFGGSGPPPCG